MDGDNPAMLGHSLQLNHIRQAMDRSGVNLGRPRRRASQFLDRMFPYFDRVSLTKHTDVVTPSGICLSAIDGQPYGVHFATKIAEKEDLFACLKHTHNKEELVIAFYSVEKGQYTPIKIQELLFQSPDACIRLDSWLPKLFELKSSSQSLLHLTAILSTALIYKGAVRGNQATLGKDIVEALVKICRQLSPTWNAPTPDAPISLTMHIASDPMNSAIPVSQYEMDPPSSGSTDRRLINPGKTRRSEQDGNPPVPSVLPSLKAEEVPDSIIPLGGSSLPIRPSPAGSLSFTDPAITPSSPVVHLAPNFVASMEAAERAEQAAQNKLALMQEHLQHMNDRIETYEQKIIRKKQERDTYRESMRQVEEELANAVEVQKDGAVTFASRVGRFLKRFSDYIPDGEPEEKRRKH